MHLFSSLRFSKGIVRSLDINMALKYVYQKIHYYILEDNDYIYLWCENNKLISKKVFDRFQSIMITQSKNNDKKISYCNCFSDESIRTRKIKLCYFSKNIFLIAEAKIVNTSTLEDGKTFYIFQNNYIKLHLFMIREDGLIPSKEIIDRFSMIIDNIKKIEELKPFIRKRYTLEQIQRKPKLSKPMKTCKSKKLIKSVLKITLEDFNGDKFDV